ncbi:MAG TPA: AMP-dependent synthetase/ligase [Actinomycetales bacterium]|nr:AMP-dependent synthetase/ligase [Actinomycetales bacterium]
MATHPNEPHSTDTAQWWAGAGAPRSLADIVPHHAQVTPDAVYLSRRDGSGWAPVTAAAFRAEVDELALGLVAAGVSIGDRVALMSKTRYEWTLCDAAIWAAGAVTVPVYETSSVDQLSWVLSDSGAVAAIVETPGHARAVQSLDAGLPALRGHWAIDAGGAAPDLAALATAGAGTDPTELEARRAALTRGSLATLIYTSGTTGRPKGCRLTHGNFLAECTAAIEALPELFEDDDASTLLFLPLAHVFGRMIEVAVLLSATHMAHSDVARLTKDLPTFRPTFVLAVPRVFERVFDSARRKAVAGGKEKVFERAADTAIGWSRALDEGGPSLLVRAQHALFDRLVYAKLRAALGGRVQWAVSGGAPLGARLGHFFRGAGVTVLEGYGLTETTAAATVNTRRGTRIGTVGRALPGFDVRIADDGEVLLRGGHVFDGYWGAVETEEAVGPVDADGWFRTGDLGSLDGAGYLTITGRSKEILVTSAGKNVSPAPLEDVVRSHPLVSQCVVVGDGRASIGALVTLDAEAVEAWLTTHDKPVVPPSDLVDDPDLLAEVRTAVDAASDTVSSAEGIKRFRVLPADLTEDAGHLTPTMKVKRAVVLAEFAAEVDALYAPRG